MVCALLVIHDKYLSREKDSPEALGGALDAKTLQPLDALSVPLGRIADKDRFYLIRLGYWKDYRTGLILQSSIWRTPAPHLRLLKRTAGHSGSDGSKLSDGYLMQSSFATGGFMNEE